jgi:hypothetical protein
MMTTPFTSSRPGTALFAGLTLLAAYPAFASDNATQGTFRAVHLNSDVPGRGLCLQFNGGGTSVPGDTRPPLPANSWLCLAMSNPLYRELTATLTIAYASSPQKTCSIVTTATASTGPFYNVINIVECQ